MNKRSTSMRRMTTVSHKRRECDGAFVTTVTHDPIGKRYPYNSVKRGRAAKPQAAA